MNSEHKSTQEINNVDDSLHLYDDILLNQPAQRYTVLSHSEAPPVSHEKNLTTKQHP